MTSITPNFAGEVIKGKLIIKQEDLFDRYVSSLSGEVVVSVKKRKQQRSLPQNNLYWFYVTMIASEMGEINKSKIHELLKQTFLREIMFIKGKEYPTVKSTTILSTKEFVEFIENIKIWVASEFGIVLPDSDEID